MKKNKRFLHETAEERVRRYHFNSQQKQRKQRLNFQEAKREGRLQGRRLAFFREILRRIDVKRKDFARVLNWTEQNVYYHIMADDMRFSDIQRGLFAFDYLFSATLEPTSPPLETIQGQGFQITGYFIKDGGAAYPEWLEECIARDSPVAFVATAIKDSTQSLGAVCKKAGIDCSSLRYYMERDDIRVSFVYQIAEVLHLRVNWIVIPEKIHE